MHVELHEGRVADAAEAMARSRLDDEDVTRTGFEFLSVDDPETATLPHELDFVVWMAMGSRTAAGESAEEEHGNIHATVIGTDKLMRAALERQVLLTDTVHAAWLS